MHHIWFMDFRRAASTISQRCPGMRTRQAARALSRLYDEALRPLGIQGSQLSVLVAVAMHGESGAAIGQLARVLVMDRTTLTRNLRPLERAGLLRTAPSVRDRRARVIVLTRGGERMLERAYPAWEAATRRIGSSFGGQELATLHAQLGALAEHAHQLKQPRS
jgi:DNA-binding MarR family transcriptional regulator